MTDIYSTIWPFFFAQKGRNPQNGQAVFIKTRHIAHFKAAQELNARVDESAKKYPIEKG